MSFETYAERPLTALDIYNSALVTCSLEEVTSFDGPDMRSRLAKRMYENTVRDLMGHSRMNFRRKVTPLTESRPGPMIEWLYAFAPPRDLLRPLYLVFVPVGPDSEGNDTVTTGVDCTAALCAYGTLEDYRVEFDVIGREIHCNHTNCDGQLYLSYAARVMEPDWPARFTQAVIYSLASLIEGSVKRDQEAALQYAKLAAIQQQRSAAQAMGERTPSRIDVSQFLRRRYQWHSNAGRRAR